MKHHSQHLIFGGLLTIALAACSSIRAANDSSGPQGSAGAGLTGYNDEGATDNKGEGGINFSSGPGGTGTPNGVSAAGASSGGKTSSGGGNAPSSGGNPPASESH